MKTLVISSLMSLMLIFALFPQCTPAFAAENTPCHVGETPDENEGAQAVTSIEGAPVVLSKSAFTYNGSKQIPDIISIDGMSLIRGTDYDVTLPKDATNAGPYTMIITGIGSYEGTTTADYIIQKAKNTLSVTGRTASVRYSLLKKSGRTFKVSKVIRLAKAGQGKRSYAIASAKKGKKSFRKYFKISSKTGKLTVKKGLKKGIYKVRIRVRAAGNSNYSASPAKTATFTLKVTRASKYVDASECYRLLNKYRSNSGRKPLKRSARLEKLARIRAKELVKNYSHTRPNGQQGYSIIPNANLKGENIAYGYTSCAQVSKAWYLSPTHKRNMLLKGFKKVGIAGYRHNGILYWVQLFSS